MKPAPRPHRWRAVAAAVLLVSPLLPADAPAQARRGSNQRRPAPPPPGNPGESALPLMAPGGPGSADAGVRLPFSLVWGDSPERLQRALAGGGTKVTERHVSANGVREVWTVEGLLRAGPKLQSVLLTFMDHALAGVELRYGEPDWDVPRFNEAMGFLRRQLERDLNGPGELVSRETTNLPAPSPAPTATPAETAPPTPTPGGSVAAIANVPAPGEAPAPAPSPPSPTSAEPPIRQTLTGYAWKAADTVVELFYFAAEQPQKALSFRTLSVHYRYNDPLAGNPDAGPNASPAPPGAPTPAFPADPNSDPLPQH